MMSDDKDVASRTVFVSPILTCMYEEEVRRHFEQFGEIDQLNLLSKGIIFYCSVQFKTVESAKIALYNKEHRILNRSVKVTSADDWQKIPDSTPSTSTSNEVQDVKMIEENEMSPKATEDVNDNAIDELEPEQFATNIMDLNDDCLIEIFRHLNSVELSNVAEMNERCKQLACSIFSLKYKKFRFPDMLMVSTKDEMDKTLRRFGHLIEALEAFDKKEWRRKKTPNESNIFLDLIVKYCGDLLNELELDSFVFLDDQITMLQSLFSKPKKLALFRCTIENKTENLLSKCSKLESLTLDSSNFRSVGLLQQRFPKLLKLHLQNIEKVDFATITMFCKSNPQLKELLIRIFIIESEIFHSIGTYLPNVEILIIDCVRYASIERVVLEKNMQCLSKLKSLTSLSLRCHGILISPLMAAMAAENIELEILNLAFGKLDDKFFDSISSMKTIKILKFSSFDGINDTHLIKFGKRLPKLERMEILDSGKNTANVIIKFLQHAIKLIRLKLDLAENEIIDLATYNRILLIVKNRPEEIPLSIGFDLSKEQMTVPKHIIQQNSKWLSVSDDSVSTPKPFEYFASDEL